MIASQARGARCTVGLAYVKDEVVFAEPTVVGLDHRTRYSIEFLPNDWLGARGEIYVPDPAASEVYQALPITREWQLVQDTGDTVVVVFDLSLETFTAFEDQRFKRSDNRRSLVANIGRRRLLHARLFQGASVDCLLQLVKP